MNIPARPHPSCRPLRPAACRAFTMIELLVVVAIILILAALLFTMVGRMSRASSAATMSNNLRQVGVSIVAYSQDHGGQLPGPLHLGQRAIYRSAPPTHLAYHLRDYLRPEEELEQGELIEILTSPMWRKMSPTERGISLLSQQDVDPDSRVRRNPWGYAGADRDDPNFEPITMSRLTSYHSLPWALIEADREHPLVGGAGWRDQTAPEPVHGSYRLALHFDGSVAQRRLHEEEDDRR